MKTYRNLYFSIFIAIALMILMNVEIASAETGCNPDYVEQSDSQITVDPNGIDDTENLQCAFDFAVADGPGLDVHLLPGAFYTTQIVVNDFHGVFSGAGAEATVVYNLPNLYVTPLDMYLNPPSAENPWPTLFAFVGGDFTISDLSIYITGDEPTTGWTTSYLQIPIIDLAHAICILGDHADASVERVHIEGEPMENSLFGYNLINGIFFEGYIGEPSPPISGSFSVQRSTFQNLVSGTPFYNLLDVEAVFSHNSYEGVLAGLDGSDVMNTQFTFSHNQVDALFGLWLYDSDGLDDVSSTFLVNNNRFQGTYGLLLEQNFGLGNQCLILGNNVQNTSDIGILLGPDIHGCTVVGSNTQDNVLDLGYDNVLVGVNNMGAGVGPTIQTLFKMTR